MHSDRKPVDAAQVPSTELPTLTRRAGKPWSARTTRLFCSGTMMLFGLALPWLGPSVLTSPGVIYLWEVPVAAAIAMAAAAAIGVTAVAPVAAASPDGPPIAKSRTVTIAALVAASIVLGTNIVAELFSVVSIGRSALELFDGEPLRLLPGPGRLLFAGAAGAALMSGAGLPPISTLRDRVARGRMGSLRGWTVLAGVLLVVLSRLDAWLTVGNYSLTGAELPVLGQILGTLTLGIAIAAAWLMWRGGAWPRLLGSFCGFFIALLAAGTMLVSGFVVGHLPTDRIEAQLVSVLPAELGADAAHTAADEIRDAGAGNGPLWSLIGIGLLASAAALPSRRLASRRRSSDSAGPYLKTDTTEQQR